MPELIRPLITTHPLTLQATGDITLTKHFDRIEIDGSTGDVTITLPDNTSPFKGRNAMEFIRVDDFTNINFIVKIVAQTPSNLAENGNEIILDIELSVQIYFSSFDDKYRSINGFSEKRIQELLPRSTCSYVSGYTTQANYMSINTTAQAHHTVDINQSGTGWILDRTTEKFASRPSKVAWNEADTKALDTTPPNQSGSFMIFLDSAGTVFTENVNNQLTLRSNTAGRNSNTELLMGGFIRNAGIIQIVLAGGGEKVNTAIRVDDIIDALGTVNHSLNPGTIAFNGANLNLDMNTGQALVRATGFLGTLGGLAPDVEELLTPVSQAIIFQFSRDNILQSVTVPGTMNVTQYEDPNNPGTFITMTNDNRTKINFYKASLSQQIIIEILGQAEYLSLQAAIDSNEEAQFPAAVDQAITVQKIAILRNETDPSANAVLISAERIDLFI